VLKPKLFVVISQILLSILLFAPLTHGQDDGAFPSDEEVQLVLTQAERAMGQYKPLVDQEEIVLGKAGVEAIAKDREVIHGIEVGVAAIRKDPQYFNGPTGFVFFEWLDDASRNALLCSTSSLLKSSTLVGTGETRRATDLVQLAQSCMNASSLIYTVSENASALYLRYTKGEQQLARQSLDVAQQCSEALKKTQADRKH
jgi:hypothetical protein